MAATADRKVPGPAGRLSVRVAGRPRPEGTVVLLHPINSAAVVWQDVAARLDEPSVAIDLRGHGHSTMSGPFTVQDGYVPDVRAVLDALELDVVHLAGGSLGGTIALALAARAPERVAGVTTFGSTLGTGVPPEAIAQMVAALHAADTAAYFRDLVPQVVGPRYRADPHLLAVMAEAAGERDESVVAAILRGAFGADVRHLVGALAATRIPVLAVTGDHDPTCPPLMSREIAEATAGESVVEPGVGHLPMLEVPDRVVELIARTVARSRELA